MDDFESLSVTAPDTLVPHLSERSRIFVYPWPVDVIPDPENIDSRLSFDCPPPEVLVERPEFITERWQDVMDGVPYRTDHEFDLVTMWRAETPIPPGTCQSQYARE
jgi:hypothetical protein